MEQGQRIKIAAVGTSHTDDGLRHDLAELFNYGRMSTYFPQVGYAKVAHLLEYATHLNVLLLEVDHLDILGYKSTAQTSMPDNHLYLLNHVHSPLYANKNADTDHSRTSFLISFQPEIAPVIHRKFLQDYLQTRGNNTDIKSGWSTLTSLEKKESAKKRVHAYSLDVPLTIDQAVRDYYTLAIAEAKKQGIDVYLIYYPQTQEYLEAIDKSNDLTVESFVAELATEKSVKILDYRHFFDSNESFFENQDHLNKIGSKYLTQDVLRMVGMNNITVQRIENK